MVYHRTCPQFKERAFHLRKWWNWSVSSQWKWEGLALAGGLIYSVGRAVKSKKKSQAREPCHKWIPSMYDRSMHGHQMSRHDSRLRRYKTI
mmetsp:Transcript_15293/g.24693  ORF Transcript_15293/g.24693 Transcript_15293/m.24693 type:complete len:91 (+) Transcript_15293:590-862(+)